MTAYPNYQTQSDDTTVLAEIFLFNCWRSQTVFPRIINLNHHTYSARFTAWYLATTNLTNQNNYFLLKEAVRINSLNT